MIMACKMFGKCCPINIRSVLVQCHHNRFCCAPCEHEGFAVAACATRSTRISHNCSRGFLRQGQVHPCDVIARLIKDIVVRYFQVFKDILRLDACVILGACYSMRLLQYLFAGHFLGPFGECVTRGSKILRHRCLPSPVQ